MVSPSKGSDWLQFVEQLGEGTFQIAWKVLFLAWRGSNPICVFAKNNNYLWKIYVFSCI